MLSRAPKSLLAALPLLWPLMAFAQEAPPAATPAETVTPVVVEAPTQVSPQIVLDEPSLMFPTQDIANFERVLQRYSDIKYNARAAVAEPEVSEDDLLAELMRSLEAGEEVKTVEDAVLPDFYVSTILYRRPGDWAVWINKEKLTARRPTSDTQGITITGVTPQSVSFTWTPEHLLVAYKRYRDILDPAPKAENPDAPAEETEMEAEAAATEGTEALPTVMPDPTRMHRRSGGASIRFNEEEKQFAIHMLSNQTFAADSMTAYEGQFQTRREALVNDNNQSKTEAALKSLDSLLDSAAQEATGERAAVNKLLGNIEKLQSFMPKVTPRGDVSDDSATPTQP
tara:strand:- start:367 stop:1389 length:1023 start_codon:yes stop_codon:yes gene_type:complete